MSVPASFLIVVTVATGTALLAAQRPAGEWSQWRGPRRDGVAAFAAPSAWPSTLTKRWELAVGEGYSSPVVSGDRVVIHTRQGEREVVRAVDLKTGKELWRNDYAAPYTMNPAARAHGPGPKSTPVIANGRVFTFGIGGILSALDLASGKVLWRTDPPAVLPEYGTAMSPIVIGPLLVAHMGGLDNGALTAFDVATGAARWRWTVDGPAYSSPVVADIGGTSHVITQTQSRVVGVDAASGQPLWQIPFKTAFNQNSITPVVSGDVVIYSGLDSGTFAARVLRKGATWAADPVWKNDQVSMYMSSPVISSSTLYGLSHRNRGQFFAIDIGTGKTLWTTPGREGDNASIILAGPLLLLSTTNAELIVSRVNAARFEELKRYTIADSAVWAHPAIAGTTIIVKDLNKLICWTI
jgi:outer membrane protein assembly factor BamB